MTILIASYQCWNLLIDRFGKYDRCIISAGILACLLLIQQPVQAQISIAPESFQSGKNLPLPWQTSANPYSFNENDVASAAQDTVPRPSSVLRKSMIIPGWGQVVNRQAWKVPVIYGMLAGLTYYSLLMDQGYQDYRAAYYNSFSDEDDQRFGPTPGYINPNQNAESLRHNRDYYRNRRDLTFIGIGLAYGLNIIDAYVFAHMRDFDVSDDLSARINIGSPGNPDGHMNLTNVDVRNGKLSFPGSVSVTFTLNIP